MKNACLTALAVSGVLTGGYVLAQNAPVAGQAQIEKLAQLEDAQERANKQVVIEWQDLLGVDIFAVHNGRITAHWDASPDKAVNLPGPSR